jgi:hypothetical protein
MKWFTFFAAIALFLSLTSCIEILDDITVHNDGTGTFKYNVNLSASKIKINSILALDSLDGKKVPSVEDLRAEILLFKTSFEKKEGVSNVQIEMDFDNYLFKLQCDFESLMMLQDAVLKTVKDQVKEGNELLKTEVNWMTWSPDKLVRSIPEINIQKIRDLKPDEVDLLNKGSYISIARFDKPINEFTNISAILSKNKLAVMLKANAYSLIQNPRLLENTIYLGPLKP